VNVFECWRVGKMCRHCVFYGSGALLEQPVLASRPVSWRNVAGACSMVDAWTATLVHPHVPTHVCCRDEQEEDAATMAQLKAWNKGLTGQDAWPWITGRQ